MKIELPSRIGCLIAGCLVALIGARSDAQTDLPSRIAGNWRVDVAQTEKYLKENSAYNDQSAEFLKFVSGTRVQFQADGAVSVFPDETTEKQGSWSFVREERGLATIQLIRGDETTETKVRFLEDDFMLLAPANEIPLVLARISSQPIEGLALELVGTWECDATETANLERNAQFTQQQIDEMMEQALRMVVEFRKDATFSATTQAGGEPQQIEGNWSAEVPNAQGVELKIHLDAARGPRVINVELREDGKVVFWPDDQPGAVFAPRKAPQDESR
jgi:hypothetical protein